MRRVPFLSLFLGMALGFWCPEELFIIVLRGQRVTILCDTPSSVIKTIRWVRAGVLRLRGSGWGHRAVVVMLRSFSGGFQV